MEKINSNPDAENPQQDLSKLPMKERLAKWKEQKGKAAATKEPTTKSALHPKSVNNAFQKPAAELRPKKVVRSTQPRVSSKVPATSVNSKPASTNPSLTKRVKAIERGKEQQATRPPQETESSFSLSSRMASVATPQKPTGSEALIFESPSSSTSSPRFGSSTMIEVQEDLYRLLDVGPSEKENEPSGRNVREHLKRSNAAMATSTQEKRIRELESELQCKRRAIESLTVRASTERAELLSQHAADKEAYERTIRETESMITELRDHLASNQTQLLRISEEHSTSILQITSLKSLVTEKETQIADLTRRLGECFEQRVPKLELDLAIQDRNNIAMELEETKDLLEECKACLEEMELGEARIADLESELVRKEGIIEELEGRLVLSAANTAKMMEEEARAAELQMAVEDLIEENDMLHAQNKELMAEQVHRTQQLQQMETVQNTGNQMDLSYPPNIDDNTTASQHQSTVPPPMQTPHREDTFTSRGVQTNIELEKLIEESQAAINRYRMIQAENCIMVQQMNQDRKKYEADVAKGRIEKAEAEKTWNDLLSATVEMREKTLQCLALSVQKNQETEKMLEDERRRVVELEGRIRHLDNEEPPTQPEPEGE